MNTNETTPEPAVNGGLILALSILGLLLCGPLTIASWLMANGALRSLQNYPYSSQRGLAQAGQVISIIGFGIWIVLAFVQIAALQARTTRTTAPRYTIGGKPMESVGGRVYIDGKPADLSTPEGSLAQQLMSERRK